MQPNCPIKTPASKRDSWRFYEYYKDIGNMIEMCIQLEKKFRTSSREIISKEL